MRSNSQVYIIKIVYGSCQWRYSQIHQYRHLSRQPYRPECRNTSKCFYTSICSVKTRLRIGLAPIVPSSEVTLYRSTNRMCRCHHSQQSTDIQKLDHLPLPIYAISVEGSTKLYQDPFQHFYQKCVQATTTRPFHSFSFFSEISPIFLETIGSTFSQVVQWLL